MGGILVPKAPKANPIAPTNNDAAVTEAARQRKLQILQGGRNATVMTSNTGDTSTASTTKTSLGGY
jgi:hypothetical protein